MALFDGFQTFGFATLKSGEVKWMCMDCQFRSKEYPDRASADEASKKHTCLAPEEGWGDVIKDVT